MARHNPRERKLFEDLTEKNRLAREFRQISSRVSSWKKRLGRGRGKRWMKQYTLSIRRAEERLEVLRAELLARAEDLRARIVEEQKISNKELSQYEKQYQKEIDELMQARKALDEARETFFEAREEAEDTQRRAEVLTEMRRRRWRAQREVRRETSEMKKAAQEVESEEQDKITLTAELQRIVAEIEGLRA